MPMANASRLRLVFRLLENPLARAPGFLPMVF
jgi:hypothetical protein